MKILNSYIPIGTPLAITIGNFDGVHLGHRAMITRLKERAPHSAIITFSNHPDEILHHTPVSHLTTLTHRLSLFEEMGIEAVILIPFTEEFSKQTARLFLTTLKQRLGFTHLILGHDGVIGHDRTKDLHPLSQELHFSLEYLEPVLVKGKVVSSSEIRKHIGAGELREAALFLGRPYSIRATVEPGKGMGHVLGFHTANLPVEELALPPMGVYAVEVALDQEILPAIANLGYAPTLHKDRPPCLEVHLLDEERDLYGRELDVRFIKYLRPEKKFNSAEELKQQIEKDIEAYKLAMRAEQAEKEAEGEPTMTHEELCKKLGIE